jgi:hypothetical protein
MSSEMLPIEWPGTGPGRVHEGLDATLSQLSHDRRLSQVHTASVAIAYTLADIMDTPGRATPRVLASQQLAALVARLEALPIPVEADSVEFDVVLLPVVDDDEG